MIAQLKGVLDSVEADHIVLDIGGVGYKVFMPLKSMSQLPEIGVNVRLSIVTIVREDSIALYGFLKTIQREMFELLLGVSGVGPKAALNILSELSVSEIQNAVASEKHSLLTRVPGIGPKTAQRITVDLKDKVSRFAVEITDDVGLSEQEKALVDAVEGLVSLGYPRYQAKKAVEKVMQDGVDPIAEAIIPQALGKLSKG